MPKSGGSKKSSGYTSNHISITDLRLLQRSTVIKYTIIHMPTNSRVYIYIPNWHNELICIEMLVRNITVYGHFSYGEVSSDPESTLHTCQQIIKLYCNIYSHNNWGTILPLLPINQSEESRLSLNINSDSKAKLPMWCTWKIVWKNQSVIPSQSYYQYVNNHWHKPNIPVRHRTETKI